MRETAIEGHAGSGRARLGVRRPCSERQRPNAISMRCSPACAELRAGALIIVTDRSFNGRRDQLGRACAPRHRLPTIYAVARVRRGRRPGELRRQHGRRRIVAPAATPAAFSRATKPADLPVQQASKFEMVINLKTAKALGIDRTAAAARPRRRGDRMRRREFIALAAAARRPMAACCARSSRAMPVVGYLGGSTPAQDEYQLRVASRRACAKPVMSMARTCRSSFAGRRAKTNACRRWPPIWFGVKSL